MVGDGDLGRTGQGYSRICFDCDSSFKLQVRVVGGTWGPPMRIQLRRLSEIAPWSGLRAIAPARSGMSGPRRLGCALISERTAHRPRLISAARRSRTNRE